MIEKAENKLLRWSAELLIALPTLLNVQSLYRCKLIRPQFSLKPADTPKEIHQINWTKTREELWETHKLHCQLRWQTNDSAM